MSTNFNSSKVILFPFKFPRSKKSSSSLGRKANNLEQVFLKNETTFQATTLETENSSFNKQFLNQTSQNSTLGPYQIQKSTSPAGVRQQKTEPISRSNFTTAIESKLPQSQLLKNNDNTGTHFNLTTESFKNIVSQPRNMLSSSLREFNNNQQDNSPQDTQLAQNMPSSTQTLFENEQKQQQINDETVPQRSSTQFMTFHVSSINSNKFEKFKSQSNASINSEVAYYYHPNAQVIKRQSSKPTEKEGISSSQGLKRDESNSIQNELLKYKKIMNSTSNRSKDREQDRPSSNCILSQQIDKSKLQCNQLFKKLNTQQCYHYQQFYTQSNQKQQKTHSSHSNQQKQIQSQKRILGKNEQKNTSSKFRESYEYQEQQQRKYNSVSRCRQRSNRNILSISCFNDSNMKNQSSNLFQQSSPFQLNQKFLENEDNSTINIDSTTLKNCEQINNQVNDDQIKSIQDLRKALNFFHILNQNDYNNNQRFKEVYKSPEHKQIRKRSFIDFKQGSIEEVCGWDVQSSQKGDSQRSILNSSFTKTLYPNGENKQNSKETVVSKSKKGIKNPKKQKKGIQKKQYIVSIPSSPSVSIFSSNSGVSQTSSSPSQQASDCSISLEEEQDEEDDNLIGPISSKFIEECSSSSKVKKLIQQDQVTEEKDHSLKQLDSFKKIKAIKVISNFKSNKQDNIKNQTKIAFQDSQLKQISSEIANNSSPRFIQSGKPKIYKNNRHLSPHNPNSCKHKFGEINKNNELDKSQMKNMLDEIRGTPDQDIDSNLLKTNKKQKIASINISKSDKNILKGNKEKDVCCTNYKLKYSNVNQHQSILEQKKTESIKLYQRIIYNPPSNIKIPKEIESLNLRSGSAVSLIKKKTQDCRSPFQRNCSQNERTIES